MMMKAFLTLGLAVIIISQVTLCSEELVAFAEVCKECFDEIDVSQEEFKNFYLNGMKAEAATEHIKCHIKCIMEKLHHMKNGVLDIEAAIHTWASMPEFKKNLPAIIEGYNVCESEKGDDDCDTAFKIAVCLYDQDVAGDLELHL